MEFECRIRGASGLAYVPVVAGGDRANIIHYVRNDSLIEDGSLVLMDAGAKMNGYCNDISRTWPVNGRFNDPQRDIYEAVLRVQKACIKAINNESSLDLLNYLAIHMFIDELGKLGFEDPQTSVFDLFPHSIGHYLGLDLHDCPSISYEEKFKMWLREVF
jgi:intermediate cleaving peptidase 55